MTTSDRRRPRAPLSAAVADRIVYWRTFTRLTQAKLAALCGWSMSKQKDMENYATHISVDDAAKVAEVLNLRLEEIIPWKKEQ